MLKTTAYKLNQLANYFFEDARHFQLLYLGSFLLFGFGILHWDFMPFHTLATLSACLLTQLMWIKLKKLSFHSLKSAMITGLGLSMLLKTSSPEIAALAGLLAISSKFIFTFKGRHFFNPANFAIISTILLTGEAWITPGQWGNSEVILFFVGAAGMMVVFKCGRIDTSLSFLATYFVLDYLYLQSYLGWPFDFTYQKYTNGAVLLFAFFMITDPITTPNHKIARIIWSMLLALVSFYLFHFKHFYGAQIWVLFYLSLLTPLFNIFWKARPFHWFHLEPKKPQAPNC
jgi:Na+-transporting NADH:ubiquinone oxidoreductase subunit NqrB